MCVWGGVCEGMKACLFLVRCGLIVLTNRYLTKNKGPRMMAVKNLMIDPSRHFKL